jgi:hypothetical protein
MRCKRFLLVAASTALIFLAGCGGSAHNPTPQGGFTNANLNGTYAISFSGTNTNGFFAVAGTLTADGNGHFTSGVLDINKAPAPVTNVPFSGTYNIRADGRGVAGLTSSGGNISLVFVLVSGGRALVTRFESSATGSGSMDLQNASAFSTTALAGTFVFNLSGVNASGGSAATLGSITTDTTGTVTSGVQDLSDNGVVTTNQPISGSIQVAGNGRGTATLNTAAGTRNFAFYVVDSNRLKLVETDTLPALAGDAFRQTGAISNASVTGPFAFTVAGNDVTFGPFAAGGVLSSDGAGTITSGTEDRNDGGAVTTNIAVTGTYALAANGRGTASITNATAGTLNFVLYPTTNGVQLLETDTGLVVIGAAFPQSGTLSTASVQGNYGLNYSAVSLASGGELDAVASLNANGTGHATGIIDINNVGSTSTGTSLTASYSADATGRGPLTLQTGLGPQNMAIYILNNNRALFVELDGDIVAAGTLEHQ